MPFESEEDGPVGTCGVLDLPQGLQLHIDTEGTALPEALNKRLRNLLWDNETYPPAVALATEAHEDLLAHRCWTGMNPEAWVEVFCKLIEHFLDQALFQPGLLVRRSQEAPIDYDFMPGTYCWALRKTARLKHVNEGPYIQCLSYDKQLYWERADYFESAPDILERLPEPEYWNNLEFADERQKKLRLHLTRTTQPLDEDYDIPRHRWRANHIELSGDCLEITCWHGGKLIVPLAHLPRLDASEPRVLLQGRLVRWEHFELTIEQLLNLAQ